MGGLRSGFGPRSWAVAVGMAAGAGLAPADDHPLVALAKAAARIVASDADAPAPRAAAKPKPSGPKGTHEQVAAVEVRGKHGGLQTLALHQPTGQVVALCGPGRYDRNYGDAKAFSEIRLVKEGKDVLHWNLPFVASAVDCGPDGLVYAAGSGKLAKYRIDGHLESEFELPQVAALVKDKAKLRAQAEEQRSAQAKSYETVVKQLEKQVKAAKPGEADKARKDKFKDEDGNEVAYEQPSLAAQLKQYRATLDEIKKRPIDELVGELVGRMGTVNSISVGKDALVVVASDPAGRGYAAWRMGLGGAEPKLVLSGLIGCCGQMDVKCCGDQLVVAENTKHGVGRFSADGKKLGFFGKQGRNGEADNFGGCCNPMNVCSGPDGGFFTSESEGFIKRFDAKGKFLAAVGQAELKGGCKNVAIAATPDGRTIYFADQPGSRVIVLRQHENKVAQR